MNGNFQQYPECASLYLFYLYDKFHIPNVFRYIRVQRCWICSISWCNRENRLFDTLISYEPSGILNQWLRAILFRLKFRLGYPSWNCFRHDLKTHTLPPDAKRKRNPLKWGGNLNFYNVFMDGFWWIFNILFIILYLIKVEI